MQSPGTSATLPPPLQTARFQEKREALLDAAAQAGASCFLVWWPRHGKAEWFGVDQWPPDRRAA
jgi:hypothetical protein